LISLKFEVLCQALNFCITNITSVQETKKIQYRKYRNQSDVHFAEGCLLIHHGEINIVACPVLNVVFWLFAKYGILAGLVKMDSLSIRE
jgi:hypothetical protein